MVAAAIRHRILAGSHLDWPPLRRTRASLGSVIASAAHDRQKMVRAASSQCRTCILHFNYSAQRIYGRYVLVDHRQDNMPRHQSPLQSEMAQGTPGHADPPDACPWPNRWPDNRPRHRAGLGRGDTSRTWTALPGPALPAESRLDRCVLGNIGK